MRTATKWIVTAIGAVLLASCQTAPQAVYVPPPAQIVKLPNPRPMPDKAEVQHFIVVANRVLFLNDEEFAKLIEQEIRKSEATIALSRETIKGPDGKPVMVRDKSGHASPQRKVAFDPKKLTDYFSRLRFQNRDVKAEIAPLPNSPRIPIKFTPQPNAGESIEQARALTSVFQSLVRKFKADPKAVVWFHVFKDSIPTYLAVRDIADQLGVPVGWDLIGTPTFTHYLPPEYTVTFTPAPTPAGGPPAVSIAAPKTTLD